MRKHIWIMMLAFICLVAPAFGATFPTLDPHTLVYSEGNGVIVVRAGDCGWMMKLYCQDNLRAGAGNIITIRPFEEGNGVMKFQIPPNASADGAVAFNFKKGDLWLGIPDCRVKTAGQVKMGMSYYTKDIAESGGAHFVYTGSGIQPWSFVASGEWCDEGYAQPRYNPAPAPAKKVTHERKRIIRKGPCPDGKGICSQPCIVEIREGVEYLVSSVGMWTKDEPVAERTLQQKARLTLDVSRETKAAVGEATPEEKKQGLGTLHKKASESIKLHKETHRMIGKSKKGDATLHEQHEKTHDKLEKMQHDVDIIKAEVLKTGGHTLPPAGSNKNQPSCSTIDCHSQKK